MFKHLLLAILLFANVAYASEGEMSVDNKLKAINMLSVNGVWAVCHDAPRSNLYGATGAEYAWNYFIFKKLSVGLTYNLLAFYLGNRVSLTDNSDGQASLSILGLRAGYYFGSRKSYFVPHLSLEGRVPIGSNTYETGGLLLNYSAGALIKLRKNVYFDFAGSTMKSKNYTYYFVKLGISSMIY